MQVHKSHAQVEVVRDEVVAHHVQERYLGLGALSRNHEVQESAGETSALGVRVGADAAHFAKLSHMGAFAGHGRQSIASADPEVGAEFQGPRTKRSGSGQRRELDRRCGIVWTKDVDAGLILRWHRPSVPDHAEHRAFAVDAPAARNRSAPAGAIELLAWLTIRLERVQVRVVGCCKAGNRRKPADIAAGGAGTHRIAGLGPRHRVPEGVLQRV